MEGIVLVLLVTFVFTGIEDGYGNKGIFAIAGAGIDTESQRHDTYQDFSKIFKEESKKAAPQIYYKGGSLYTGTNRFSDCIGSADYTGQEIPFQVTEILSPSGADLLADYHPDTTEIHLSDAGVYTVCIRSIDDGKRVTQCRIKIPVNK